MTDLASTIIGSATTLVAVGLGFLGGTIQQSVARKHALHDKIRTVTSEVIEASTTLQTALALTHAEWNTWEPRFKTLGKVGIEFLTGKAAGGLHEGVARAVREVSDWNERRDSAVNEILKVDYARLNSVLAHAVLLPDREIAVAAARVGQTAIEAMKAYAADGLYNAKAAKEGRERATEVFGDAVSNLIIATNRRLNKRRWWRRAFAWIGRKARRRAAPVEAAAVPEVNAGNSPGGTAPPTV